MSTVNEILKAVREVVVMNERVANLSQHVERLEANQTDLRERVIRIETFIEMVRPALARGALPSSPKGDSSNSG